MLLYLLIFLIITTFLQTFNNQITFIMKKLNWKFLTLMLFVFIGFTACEEKSNSEKAADKIENTTEEIGDAFRSDREELKEDMEDAVENIEEKIDEIKENMDDATAEAQANMKKQVAKLEAERKELSAEMEKLGDRVADNWDDFKKGVKTRLNNIEKEIDRKF